MNGSSAAIVPVDLPARSWAVIDATMDNVAHMAMFEHDEGAELCRAVVAVVLPQLPA